METTGKLTEGFPELSYGVQKYFHETTKQTFQPRSLLIDLEPSTLDQIRGSPGGLLYSPDQYLFDQVGTGNIYARGHYGQGAELAELVTEGVRKQVEACDCFLGFQFTHSIGGGTGSGLGSLLIANLREQYCDRLLTSYTVFPSLVASDIVTEPYNAILSIEHLLENADLVMLFDNEALYRLVSLNQGIERPTYREINQCIATAMGGITASFRFPGLLNSNYRKMAVNLVPHPRLHFLTVSHAPLSPLQSCTVPTVVETLFSPHNYMTSGQSSNWRSLTHFACFRGNLRSSEIEESVSSLLYLSRLTPAHWPSAPVSLSLCPVSSVHSPLSATLVLNHGVVTAACRRVIEQFRRLFSRKAFVHWYSSEGMELMELTEAVCNVEDMCSDYGYGHLCEEEEETCENSAPSISLGTNLTPSSPKWSKCANQPLTVTTPPLPAQRYTFPGIPDS